MSRRLLLLVGVSVSAEIEVWRTEVRTHDVAQRVVRVGCGYGCQLAAGSGRICLPEHVIDMLVQVEKNIERQKFPEKCLIISLVSNKNMYPYLR